MFLGNQLLPQEEEASRDVWWLPQGLWKGPPEELAQPVRQAVLLGHHVKPRVCVPLVGTHYLNFPLPLRHERTENREYVSRGLGVNCCLVRN